MGLVTVGGSLLTIVCGRGCLGDRLTSVFLQSASLPGENVRQSASGGSGGSGIQWVISPCLSVCQRPFAQMAVDFVIGREEESLTIDERPDTARTATSALDPSSVGSVSETESHVCMAGRIGVQKNISRKNADAGRRNSGAMPEVHGCFKLSGRITVLRSLGVASPGPSAYFTSFTQRNPV